MTAPFLHVAPVLWSGAGRVITRLCLEQAADRRVILATTGARTGERDWPSYRRALARAGVEHHRIDLLHRDADSYWAAVDQLTDLLRAERPAVVHAHAGVPAGAAAMARHRAGVRTRLVGQMYSWGVGRPSWMDVQDAWGFLQADVVVCSAHAYRAKLVALGVPATRLAYLPWGLDLDALPLRTAPPVDPPTIGFVGRLEPRKQQLALVEAFARFRRASPGARLVLVGPAADEGYARVIRQAVARLDLGGAVTIAGQVRDVVGQVRQWHLFVSLSSDEGQGLAVLEAMAIGVPVLARRVAGVEDFLDDGVTGWTVANTSPTRVAAAMRRALEASGRAAVIRRARALVERRYDWRRMMAQIARLYRG